MDGRQQQPDVEGLPQHSDNVDEELRRIHLALNAVFSTSQHQHGNHQQSTDWYAQRQLADRYLTSFQGQSISWMVCDRLLQEPDSSASASLSVEDSMIQQQRRFFAAQTLHIKCCSDVQQLPAESLPSLRDSLLAHLKRSCSSVGIDGRQDSALVNRLAMCTSALAVQMGWSTIITDFLSPNNNNYYDIAMPILRTLPEECASDRLLLLDENTRYIMRDHLISSAPMVFAFLLSTIREQQQASTENVFKVFFIWIRYVPVHPNALVETPLLSSSMSCLTQPQYLEMAADVVVEVLHMYPSHHYGNEELVKLMIPGLSQLPLEEALGSNDEDVMRVYCRLVTEMGESYMSLILSTDYQQSSKLVEWVLRCSEIPDSEISSITFNFWYRMVMDLEGCEPYEWRQELIDFYTPHLLKLMNVCVSNLMKFPNDIDEVADDRLEDLKNHRLYVSETIEDCCRLLGGQLVLQQLGSFMKDEVQRVSGRQQSAWYGLESGLSCIGALHRFVPADEADILPFCFQLIPQLPPDARLLRFTASKVIGSFAFWLARHPELLQPLLPYLSQGLHITNCASAAATAIKQLCECSNQNFSMAEPVLNLYEDFTAQPGRLDLQDELQILEGLCKALSRTIQDTRDDGRGLLARLVQPIGSRFTATVANEHSSPKTFVPELDRLTVILQFLKLPTAPGEIHPFIGLVQSLWELLDNVTFRFPGDVVLAEKICRFHKYALRSCGSTAYRPMLEALIHQLVRSFERTRQSPFLYAASICITEHARDPSLSQPMYDMVAAMANTAFSFLRTYDELTNHPDVVEEFFYLMGRMVDHFPDPLVVSSLLKSLCKCAVVAMQLDHHGAHKGTLKFLDCIISYGLKLREQNKPDCQNALQNVFSEEGQEIVINVTRVLAGDLPSYSNQTPDILWKLSVLYPSLLSRWLSAAFDDNLTTTSMPSLTALPIPERARIEFVAAVDLGLAREEFNLIVNAFRSACERERRIRRVRAAQQLHQQPVGH